MKRAYFVPVAIVMVIIGIAGLFWHLTAPQRSLKTCKGNLKTIGLALHAYHAGNGSFPAAYSQSQPPHSWRVALLPWLDQQQLHDSYNQHEAWDSEGNRKLLKFRPNEYRCPEVLNSTHSSYMAVLGPEMAWPYDAPSRLIDYVDGTANTVMIIDLHNLARDWTRPNDAEYSDILAAANKGFRHDSPYSGMVTTAMFADGSVRTFSDHIDESVMRMIMTPNGGRPLLEQRAALERTVGTSEAFKEPIDCSSLPATQLWPTPAAVIRPGNSVLYCPTLALAWQQYIHQQPQVELSELGEQLRNSPFSSADISPSALQITTNSESTAGPNVICRLKKHLAFSAVFDSFDLPLTFFDPKGPHTVKSFGVTSHWTDWRFALAQVRVHDYRSPDDFVVSIANLNAEDLILAKIPQPQTLDTGIQEVTKRIRDSRVPPKAREVVANEDLVIPVLELSVFGDFKDELNHPDQPAGTRAIRARQELQFRLDERGAVVRSEAEMIGENGAYEYEPGTRTFIFDKPFLVMLREAPVKQPYFAAWIGNTDLMVPRDKRK